MKKLLIILAAIGLLTACSAQKPEMVTGRMGDGWAYRYDQNIIRGLKQTHQPSPWINDYGQFAIMPVRDASDADEDSRASWFSHKSETAKPYYYQVYLADHDIKEITVRGRKWKENFFRYSDLAKGNVIEFTMER